MPPIKASINELSTIQKVFDISEAATKEAGQEYTFLTFDLPVAKKAYHIMWQNPGKYEKFVIHLGAFHTMLSYLGAIGKSIKESGFEEIVCEAGLCASGSMDRVLSGKHYNRSLRVHTVMTEALEMLLFDYFLQCTDKQGLVQELLKVVLPFKVELTNKEFTEVTESDAFIDLFSEYEYFKQLVRNGSKGKTAQFWLQYMDHVWLLLQFSYATRHNNFALHMQKQKEVLLGLVKICQHTIGAVQPVTNGHNM